MRVVRSATSLNTRMTDSDVSEATGRGNTTVMRRSKRIHIRHENVAAIGKNERQSSE